MLVTYRYERWEYYESGEKIDEEVDLWIKNFDPSSLKNDTEEPSSIDVSIQVWNNVYEGYGKSGQPTYREYGFTVDEDSFAVDLLWFAELVLELVDDALKKYSQYIGWFTLFVNIDTYAGLVAAAITFFKCIVFHPVFITGIQV